MTDGEALLRAVLANPADDTARLVYADFLQENGHEPTAKFIRFQIEGKAPAIPPLAHLLDVEPLMGQPHQLFRRGFQGRAEVSKLKPRVRPLDDNPDGQIVLTYRRGFIDEVEMDHAEFGWSAGLLFRRHPIRSVWFWTDATEYALGLNGRAGNWTFDLARIPEYLWCQSLENRFRTRELAERALSDACCDYGKRRANKIRESEEATV